MAGRLGKHRWMNEWEVVRAVQVCVAHPVLREATEFLVAFLREVNGHSDGWAHWAAPGRAAGQLMDLLIMAAWERVEVQRWFGVLPPTVPVTVEQYQKALRPIKAFYTRRGYKAGMKWPIVGVAKRLLGAEVMCNEGGRRTDYDGPSGTRRWVCMYCGRDVTGSVPGSIHRYGPGLGQVRG